MIIFEGKLNSELSQELNKFQLKRLWWLFLIIGLLAIYLVGKYIVAEDYVTAIGYAIFFILFPIFTIIFAKIYQKNIDKSLKIMSDETRERFEFLNGKVTIIQQKGEDFNCVTEANFSYFYKVIETKTHYILYISKAQCHIIKKENIVEGSLQELNEMFKQYIKPSNLKLLS